MKYIVSVSEVLRTEIAIEANSEQEAIGQAKQMYHNCSIVLTADDFEDVSFSIKKASMSVEEFVQQNIASLLQNKFFKRDYGFEEIYYNPDASSGGQLVYNRYSYDLIREAIATGSEEEFYQLLESNCEQYTVDIDSEYFIDYAMEFINNKSDYTRAEITFAMITTTKHTSRKEDK